MVLHLLLLLQLLVSLVQTGDSEFYGFRGSELELKLADLETSYIVSEVFTSRRPDNVKCPLSQLQHDMKRYKTAEYQQLPRLAELKARYPGEKFTRLKGSWCENVSQSYQLQLCLWSDLLFGVRAITRVVGSIP